MLRFNGRPPENSARLCRAALVFDGAIDCLDQSADRNSVPRETFWVFDLTTDASRRRSMTTPTTKAIEPPTIMPTNMRSSIDSAPAHGGSAVQSLSRRWLPTGRAAMSDSAPFLARLRVQSSFGSVTRRFNSALRFRVHTKLRDLFGDGLPFGPLVAPASASRSLTSCSISGFQMALGTLGMALPAARGQERAVEPPLPPGGKCDASSRFRSKNRR